MSSTETDRAADRAAMAAAQHAATQVRIAVTATAAELARQHRYLVSTTNQAQQRLGDEQAGMVADQVRSELAAALSARLDEHEHTALELLETELDALRRFAGLDHS